MRISDMLKRREKIPKMFKGREHGGVLLLRGLMKKKKNKNITNCWKGVNVVEYCKCEGFTDCSTQWDPYDGKSITQAQSDQYKVGIFACCKMIEIISKRKRNC